MAEVEENSEKLQDKRVVMLEMCYDECGNSNIVFLWRVHDYAGMNFSTMYFQDFQRGCIEYRLNLFKMPEFLHVALSSKDIYCKEAQFCLLDVEGRDWLSSPSVEVQRGLYSAKFDHEVFLDSRRYRKDAPLTISFRYAIAKVAPVQGSFLQETIPDEEKEEFCDLRHLYLESLFPNFLIHVKNRAFKAHRYVLASRSKFFKDFCEQNASSRQCTLPVDPKMMHLVLLYIYTGYRMVMDKMNIKCVLEMYKLALMLKIVRLEEQCLLFVEENISKFNIVYISEKAVELNSAGLKSIVIAHGPYQK